MSEAAEIPIDRLVLPVLGKPGLCEECRRAGLSSRLTAMVALVEKLEGELAVEVHSYGCSRGHWWNRRTKARPVVEVLGTAVDEAGGGR